MKIKAVVEETAMFGENLRMTREYLCNAGKNEMRIFDTVENIGFSTEQLMLNYHFNFGYPFVSEHTKVESATDTVLPQKDYMPKKGYEDFAVPTDGHPSLVYYHGVGESDDAFAEIINPEFPVMNGKVRMPVKVRLKWSSVDLPNMVHWKMPASGNYVLGIQPANCLVDGRVKEKENGTAIYLEPGRKMTYQLGLELE